MPIRRQGFEWEITDLGNLPPKRLADLENPQSIFVSGFGKRYLEETKIEQEKTSSLLFNILEAHPVYGHLLEITGYPVVTLILI